MTLTGVFFASPYKISETYADRGCGLWALYYIVPTEDHIKEMKSSRMWKDILKEPGYCAANEGIQALAQAVVAGRTDLASGNQKSNT